MDESVLCGVRAMVFVPPIHTHKSTHTRAHSNTAPATQQAQLSPPSRSPPNSPPRSPSFFSVPKNPQPAAHFFRSPWSPPIEPPPLLSAPTAAALAFAAGGPLVAATLLFASML